jgi:hypothetical protein
VVKRDAEGVRSREECEGAGEGKAVKFVSIEVGGDVDEGAVV